MSESEYDDLKKRLRFRADKIGTDALLGQAAQAIERLKGERDNAIEQAAMECAVVEELDKTCKALRQQLADARARAFAEVTKKAEQVTHSALIAWLDGEILATPAPESRVIPDGAHHSGLMKDYGGRYNPAFKAPSTGEAELCPRCTAPSATWPTICHADDCPMKAAQQQEQEG